MIKCKVCGFEAKSRMGFIRHTSACNRYELLKNNIIDNYNSGESISCISKKYDLRSVTVSGRLKLWGVTKRNENSERYYLRGKKNLLNEDYFSEMGDIQYWMLGMYASDGSVSGKNNEHIFISQSGIEGKKRIEYIRSQLNLNYEIRTSKPKIGKCVYSLFFSSYKIGELFSKYNIIKNKTKSFTLPDDIRKYYLPSFIAGYVEGDGCISFYRIGGRQYLVASFVGTKDFIEKCYEMIPIKGVVRKHSNSDVFEIRWTGEKAVLFCDWMYSYDGLYHSYKYDNYIRGKEIFQNSRRHIVNQIKKEIISGFNSGIYNSVKECAASYDLNETLVYNWFKKWYDDGTILRDYHLKKVEV